MIERKIITQNMKEFEISEHISKNLKGVGHSNTVLKKTPLGEKVIVSASRPGLVVGKSGANIKKLTKVLKTQFKLENPQIEISEVENINLDANIVSERISGSLERFGSGRFKGIMHSSIRDIMLAGAKGAEIILSGKIPGARAKKWRVSQGYLKKSGDIALTGVDTSYSSAQLKTGIVGIKVKIMPPDTELPDSVHLKCDEPVIEELPDKTTEAMKETDGKKKPASKTKSKKPKTKDKNLTETADDVKTDEDVAEQDGEAV